MSKDEDTKSDNEKYLDYLELALEEADKNGILPYSVEIAWIDYKASKDWK